MTAVHDLSGYLAAPYHRVFTMDDGLINALVLELPGCFSSGTSPEEAWKNLDEAMTLWIESELEAGNPIPEPLNPEAFSGRVTLRLPPSVHYRAAMLAELEGVSLNRLLSVAVASYPSAARPEEAEPTQAPVRRKRTG